MDPQDKRDLGIIGAGAGTGAAAGVARPLGKMWDARQAASKHADQIVKHLEKNGITTKHRIVIIGVPGSGKSTISRALERRGFSHYPLDRPDLAHRISKGVPPGALVDHTMALKKTGGGHYDAIIKTHTPDPAEIRRRLVQRGSGALKIGNKVDYGLLEKSISSDFDKLHGDRTRLSGGTVVIPRDRVAVAMTAEGHRVEHIIREKDLNARDVPKIGSSEAWKYVQKVKKPANPIRQWEIIRGRPEFRGGVGALIGGGLTAGIIAARRRLDKSTTNKAMSSRIDRLITLNSQLGDIVQFRDPYDDQDSTFKNVAVGAGTGVGLGAAGVGGVMGHRAIMRNYGTRLALKTPPQLSQPGTGGFTIGAPAGEGTLASKVGVGGAYKSAAKDISANIGQRFSGAAQVGKQAYATVGRRGGSAVDQIWAALRKGAKYAVR